MPCITQGMWHKMLLTLQLPMTHSTQPANHNSPRQWGHLYQAHTPLPELLKTESTCWALFPPSSVGRRSLSYRELTTEIPIYKQDTIFKQLPVGHINADNGSLQQLSILVGTAGQQPALVVRQTVGYKEDIVFLRCLTKRLTQLCLLVLNWSQDKWWCVEMNKLCPLQKKEYSTQYSAEEFSFNPYFLIFTKYTLI